MMVMSHQPHTVLSYLIRPTDNRPDLFCVSSLPISPEEINSFETNVLIMLPEIGDEPQGLPPIDSFMNEPPMRNPMEDYYLQNQYHTPLPNYTYQAPPMYFNPWPPAPMQPVYQPYVYDQQFAAAVEPQFQDNTFEENGSSPKRSSGEKTKKSPPKSYQEKLDKLTTRDAVCANCSTSATTLWRKNGDGNLECNACNLYYRHNKIKRPMSLRKDRLATRKRRQMTKKEKSHDNN
uniref:GATA-type domain-containing protein n=1 Tax=Caenorhabditis tropicalis TaxID=1561998 RepID=A0A1I7V1X0_9PELO